MNLFCPYNDMIKAIIFDLDGVLCDSMLFANLV